MGFYHTAQRGWPQQVVSPYQTTGRILPPGNDSAIKRVMILGYRGCGWCGWKSWKITWNHPILKSQIMSELAQFVSDLWISTGATIACLCQTQAESWTSIFGGVMVLQREACGKSLSLRVILGEDYWRTSHFWSDLPVEGTKLYHFGIPTQCRSNRLLLSWMNPWMMWCGIPARLVQLFLWKTWWWVFYFQALRVIPKNQLHLVGASNFSSILILGKDWN